MVMELEARRERSAARFEGIHCSMLIACPASHVVIVTIRGSDVGEFADAPFVELASHLDPTRLVDLFIDSRDTKGASIGVSNDWATWLGKHRRHFRSVTMLVGSRFIMVTANFVRRFAMLEDIMRITTDSVAFDAAAAAAIRESATPW